MTGTEGLLAVTGPEISVEDVGTDLKYPLGYK